jgi:coenzyme F420-reducing hydrogenase delta subunit
VVARVDPARCVSCGICAASCAPMGVGPPGRTGRDQIEQVRGFLAGPGWKAGEVVTIACVHGAGALADLIRREGAVMYPVDCAGNLHTSVVELLVRGGAGGVVVLPCPPRDCRNREGPRWLRARIYEGREAELQARVDRRRIAVIPAGARELGTVAAAVRAMREVVRELDRPDAEKRPEPDTTCEPAPPLRRGARR